MSARHDTADGRLDSGSMNELGKRVAVAAVGIPAVLALVFLGGWYLAVLAAIFAALSALELYRFCAGTEIEPLSAIGASAAVGMVLLAGWRPAFHDFAPWALALVGVLTGVLLVLVIFVRSPDNRPLAAASVTLFGAVYAGLALAAVPLLHALPAGRGWAGGAGDPWAGFLVIALPLAATWVGDACAYFAGTTWGERRLAPSISPNKSWVGFWANLGGAAAAAAVWFVIAAPRLTGLPLGLGGAVGLGAMLGLGAVVGDLVESLLKREAGVKDSGRIFPGHGGVLDRLDALLFTLPLAYVALVLIGGGV